MLGLSCELKWTIMAIEPLLMAVGHCQGFAIGIQSCKKADAPKAIATYWVLLATAAKNTQFTHGGLQKMQACVELGGAPFVFKQNGEIGFASQDVNAASWQLSGVKNVG